MKKYVSSLFSIILQIYDIFVFNKNKRIREYISYASFVMLVIRYPGAEKKTKELRKFLFYGRSFFHLQLLLMLTFLTRQHQTRILTHHRLRFHVLILNCCRLLQDLPQHLWLHQVGFNQQSSWWMIQWKRTLRYQFNEKES